MKMILIAIAALLIAAMATPIPGEVSEQDEIKVTLGSSGSGHTYQIYIPYDNSDGGNNTENQNSEEYEIEDPVPLPPGVITEVSPIGDTPITEELIVPNF